MDEEITGINRELYDTPSKLEYIYKAPEGLTEDIIRKISSDNNEPEWMLTLRLEAFELFKKAPMPTWGPDLSELDLDKIIYYQHPDAPYNQKNWDDVPDNVKETFEKLGIPEAERKALAGAGAQMESKMAYHNLKEEWESQGVIFLDMDEALKLHPELVKQYFSKVVPINDHKFASLHYAVWSGGTFLYIPKGVHVSQPVQAYFRMNSMRGGQFEHTLIVVEEDAHGSYYEGCSAPKYDDKSLHAGCVEVFVKKNSRFRYSSVENWSSNTYNLNTKRGIVYKDATLEWVGGNLGSGCTMLYPCSLLVAEGARAEHLAIAFATKGQNQDTGAKVYHNAPRTTSRIVSKSIAIQGGITAYRGLLRIAKGAKGAKSNVECDALMIDNISQSNTYPYIDIQEQDVDVGHEATVGRISDEQIFYLMSRGISEEDAVAMLVNGFMEPITKELPIEYAAEMNKLIALEMEGSIG